ncbi:MAG: FHA domain-containing protein [Myxococcales bacterium]|nr:FHA domain-containing protein [Myxococcales bacterium]
MSLPDDPLDSATRAQAVPVLTARPSVRSHQLQQVEGPGAPQLIELRGTSLIIGRSPEAEVRIPSSSLSRQHVRLDRGDDGWTVTDLDSSNGLYLNEIRIYSAELRDGDTVQLSDALFVYFEGR